MLEATGFSSMTTLSANDLKIAASSLSRQEQLAGIRILDLPQK